MRRLLWLCLSLPPTVVLAQAPAPTPRALFEDGVARYDRGDYEQAAASFEGSYALRPVPLVLFNIARSWEKAGKPANAINAWQAWLAASPSSPQRQDVERSLRTLGDALAKLGLQALTITSLPGSARVTIDGVARGTTPVTVELQPTRHLLRLDLTGREPVERVIDFTLEAPRVEAFELPPLNAPTPRVLQTPPPPAPPAPSAARPAPLQPPAGPAPLPPQTLPPGPERLGAGVVTVHLETDNPGVRLYRALGDPRGECLTPCDMPINRPDDVFFIAGDNVTPSSTFVLSKRARRGQVNIGVKAGNQSASLGLGLGFVTLGMAGTIPGAVFLFSPSDSASKGWAAIGLTVGLVSIVVAVVALVVNATTVTFDD
ncbi:MAG: PEGA domain-containing protein [Myxococcaceae bacterium]|nr:PEGA domain-containing protein [Myxococcaceae bacterium]MCA3014346.1 PEGA domain-containing protein [Myxococcaceae bacterium]